MHRFFWFLIALLWIPSGTLTADPLHDAVCKGDLKEINHRIDEGSDINSQDSSRYGATPLHVTVMCSQESAAELLIERGAEIDDQGGRIVGTPLYGAAYSGNIIIAKLLIDKGANVNAKSADKSTPLHAATNGRHVSIAKLLIDNGADVNAKKRYGRTPLYLAAKIGHADLVELLIKSGAKIETKTPDTKNTALDIAIRLGHKEAAQVLRKHGSTSTAKPLSVIVDQRNPAFIVFTGIVKDTDDRKLEEIRLKISKQENVSILTWEQFTASVDRYARSTIERNDYPNSRVVDGLVCLVGRQPGTPWGLTWNGGIALTFNDYEHVKQRYESYTTNPSAYSPILDPRADPVNPGGHLPVFGCLF